MRKIKIPNEILYLTGICGLALAVAMIAASRFGMSPIVCPAFVLSRVVPRLTFGTAEYLIQTLIFAVFCFLMGGFRPVYLSSYANCVIYGALLDFWRAAIPLLNPQVTAPGSMDMPVRVALFVFGWLLTGASVSIFYKTYMYPQLYDFFVRGISGHFGIKRLKFKLCFDFGCFLSAVLMSLLFLGHLEGIGIGTLFMTCTMGFLLEFYCRIYDRYFEFPPVFDAFAKKFELH